MCSRYSKHERSAALYGTEKEVSSPTDHDISPTKRAGSPAWLVCALPFAGSHRPTDSATSITMLAYSHNTDWGRVVFHGKHLFISLKSVPSTRPVKTTPTQLHNWSESVKEPIKRSAASRNMQHIHTVWSPMGHRGARKITELGPYHLSLSGRQRTPFSAHVFPWNVCVRERERRNKVCVCVWGCMSGASKGRGIIRRYRNISTRRPRCRTEANKKERILTGMPIL